MAEGSDAQPRSIPMTRPRPVTGDGRRFLFLQGPHGPFFWRLGRVLRQSGAGVLRVGFNAGDALFWPDPASYIPFRDAPGAWPARLDALIAGHGITDIAMYGDMRPVHAAAARAARAQGLTLHVFEEGYLRPFWITYERGGVNGHSRLMKIPVADMRIALDAAPLLPAAVPARWGDLRAHVFYGALYHFPVMAMNRGYPGFRPHRDLTVGQEFRAYLRRLLALPWHAASRFAATRAIRRGGFAYHLALLQLAHDASVRGHSDFAAMEPFIDRCLDAFAAGAPPHHHLVVKAHPLDDGRAPLRRHIARRAQALGLAGRVHFVRGGKLGPLLEGARGVVTINSTAAQQALWRGLPVRVLGRAVYGKPELVSDQPLSTFFADPRPPEAGAYAVFRGFLLATSQVPGGYYSAAGRRRAIPAIADRMLDLRDPYARTTDAFAQRLPTLRAVAGGG
jgi:capsular polysaccharide export protein